MGTNTEIHKETLGRVRDIHSTLNEISPSTSSPHGTENPVEEETEKVEDPEGMEDTMETGPSKSTLSHSCELTEAEAVSTRPAWVCSRSSVFVLQY